jgi:hypothetical protein
MRPTEPSQQTITFNAIRLWNCQFPLTYLYGISSQLLFHVKGLTNTERTNMQFWTHYVFSTRNFTILSTLESQVIGHVTSGKNIIIASYLTEVLMPHVWHFEEIFFPLVTWPITWLSSVDRIVKFRVLKTYILTDFWSRLCFMMLNCIFSQICYKHVSEDVRISIMFWKLQRRAKSIRSL